jgi:hypothetical protein
MGFNERNPRKLQPPFTLPGIQSQVHNDIQYRTFITHVCRTVSTEIHRLLLPIGENNAYIKASLV